jgi:hypothetical protein
MIIEDQHQHSARACMLQNALLITASITPFSQAATQASTARGQSVVGAMMPDQNRTWLATAPVEYHHQAFGALWAITLSFSCVALTVSMLLLGYMLAVPDESVYTWAIQNGEKNHLALPAKFTLLGTLMFIFSVAYSAAVYYGLWVIPPVVLIFLFGLMAGFCGVFKFPWRGNKSNSNALGVAAAARQADKVKAAGKHSLPGHCGGFFGTSPSNDIDGQHPFSIVISNASVPGASQQSGQSKDVETKPEEEICA